MLTCDCRDISAEPEQSRDKGFRQRLVLFSKVFGSHEILCRFHEAQVWKAYGKLESSRGNKLEYFKAFHLLGMFTHVHAALHASACLSMPRTASVGLILEASSVMEVIVIALEVSRGAGESFHHSIVITRNRWCVLTCAYYGQPLALIVIFERTSQNSTCSTCDPGSQTSVFHSAEWPDGWWQHCLY